MKVLIIRLSAMGDVVMTSPVVRWLDIQLDAEVHFLTKEVYATVVNNNPRIKKVHLFNGDLKHIIGELKLECFDLIIDLHKNLRSRRIVNSLGLKFLSFDKLSIEKWMYLKLRINRLHKSHIIDRFAAALSSQGIIDDGLGMEFHIDPSAEKSIDIPFEKFIAVVAGGTYVTKRIPQHIIKGLIDYGNNYVILGGEDVDPSVRDIQGSNIVNLITKTSLQESATIINRSDLVVTGDTGLMHIAAALQKPIVTIWGSTNEEFGFYPYYGINHTSKSISIANTDLSCRPCSKYGVATCPKGHMKCMNELLLSEVHNAIKTLSA